MRIKLFENFYDGYINVPTNFEDKLKGLEDTVKRKREVYDAPENQLKIDLYYGIKWKIREFLDDINRGYIVKTQKEYENYLNSEIYYNDSGILKKFSEGKFDMIKTEDIGKVKSILWKYIKETIPYDEVDYYHTYNLNDKLLKLLDEFILELKKKKLI